VFERLRTGRAGGLEGGAGGQRPRIFFFPGRHISGTTYFRDDILPGRHISGTT
jgi:hypothetical protein